MRITVHLFFFFFVWYIVFAGNNEESEVEDQNFRTEVSKRIDQYFNHFSFQNAIIKFIH